MKNKIESAYESFSPTQSEKEKVYSAIVNNKNKRSSITMKNIKKWLPIAVACAVVLVLGVIFVPMLGNGGTTNPPDITTEQEMDIYYYVDGELKSDKQVIFGPINSVLVALANRNMLPSGLGVLNYNTDRTSGEAIMTINLPETFAEYFNGLDAKTAEQNYDAFTKTVFANYEIDKLIVTVNGEVFQLSK